MPTTDTPTPEVVADEAMIAPAVPAGQPLDVVPVASFRTRQAPNRKNRRTDFHLWGEFAFAPKQTVKAYSHRATGSLLFVMPDNSAYEVQVPVVANQVFRHWLQKQPSEAERSAAVDEAEPASPL